MIFSYYPNMQMLQPRHLIWLKRNLLSHNLVEYITRKQGTGPDWQSRQPCTDTGKRPQKQEVIAATLILDRKIDVIKTF